MKKVVLTGANGFIGKQAIACLEKNDYEVHCTTTKDVSSTDKNITWHKVDLLNENKCRNLFSAIRPTHLLHFSWYTEPGRYWSSEKNYDWLRASLNMLNYFKRYGGERAAFAGTCAEYDWSSGVCSESTTPLKPRTTYGLCKDRLRREAGSFCSENGVTFSWGRIFFLYGPYEHPSRLVSSMVLSLLRNEEARCTHGRQLRDFLFSEDVASAFVKILDSSVEGAINIGSGTPVSIKEIIDMISTKLGKSELIRFGELPVPVDDPPLIVADIKKLKEEVGWKPEHDLGQGLDKTIAWWRQNL